jgi:hypothetical protein
VREKSRCWLRFETRADNLISASVVIAAAPICVYAFLPPASI